MSSEVNVIKEQIEETKENLIGQIDSLEGKLRDSVSEAQDAISSLVTNFTPAHQIEAHPIAAVVTAATAGLLLGKLIAPAGREAASFREPTSSSSEVAVRRPSESKSHLFSEELAIVRDLARGTAVKVLGEFTKKAFPEYEHSIDEVFGRVLAKLEQKAGTRSTTSYV